MTALYVLLLLAAMAAIGRIIWSLRKIGQARNDSWDEKVIDQLRKGGSDPFQPHDVDFFFAMPDEPTARKVAGILDGEGFRTDVEHKDEIPSQPYSVHALRSMRLSAPDMKSMSRRFTQLAAEVGGTYDGWIASHVDRKDDNSEPIG
ncbi:MAG: ribonuclease E inhibitor RraB [Pseudomonadales bacterium]|nr:ribonuclease E inhibitor RraB [Pseudomonadales bacterium]